MSSAVRIKRRWDALPYQSIASVSYERGALNVCFQDGSCVSVAVNGLLPADTPVDNWESVTSTADEIVVPTERGPVEISWLAIRSLTDHEFDAFLREMADKEDRIIGARIRELRLSRGLSDHELAERSGLPFETIRAIEDGRMRAGFSTLERVLEPLGYDLDDLTDVDRWSASASVAPSASGPNSSAPV